ncbi:heme peroxidase [Aeromicrobium halocynthiae]|uniref:Heme peroxidase n=1 Tax=Aeromicrobium halocynthiae TaxID=560557 RepID=A0ABN2W1E3_9ACTN
MTAHDEHLSVLRAALEEDFPDWKMPPWPGGWVGQIEAALIDAVFSIRARYGSETTGVRAVVSRWRAETGDRKSMDDLRRLADPTGRSLTEVAANGSETGGKKKSDVVQSVAAAMVEAKVLHSADLQDDTKFATAKRIYLSQKGLGKVTWSYFAMLNGIDDVKADTHVVAYVNRKLGLAGSDRLRAEAVRDLLLKVDHGFEDRTALDHAIWRRQSKRDV